jgi:molybdate transport system regulatory protein
MADDHVEALIRLRKATSRVGPDRINLLEVVREKGPITSAARTLNMSYKAAWNAISALNNLFEQPMVVAQQGGKSGGRAFLTPALPPRGRPVGRQDPARLRRSREGRGSVA